MVQFNELPLELQFKIFELLEISDILVSRLVCKHWRSVLCEIKIEELVFCQSNQTATKWHFDPVPVRNVIIVTNPLTLKLLSSTIFNLKNLKRLMIRGSINYDGDEGFKIEQLNKFPKLEHIEFDEWNGEEEKLLLPKLKQLYLSTIYSGELQLDAPVLESVLVKIGILRVNLQHAETLKHLEIFSFKDKVFEFIGLETLKLDHTDAPIRNMLQQLPKLRLIEFTLHDYIHEFFEHIVDTLRDLVLEKERLNRTDLKIYFKNQLVTSENQVNLYEPQDFFEEPEIESELDDLDSQFDYSDPDNLYNSFSDFENFGYSDSEFS